MTPAASLDNRRTTRRSLTTCSRSRGTLVSRSIWLRRTIPAPCRAWVCPYCGRRKARKVARKLDLITFERFFTLTQLPRPRETQLQAFQRIARDWQALVKRIRRQWPNKRFEYCRVYEVTQNGQPHIHVLCLGPWIPQKWLSRTWREISGAYIVDIRQIRQQGEAKSYLTKYLSKGGEMPSGLHRYQLSWALARQIQGEVEELTSERSDWQYKNTSIDQWADAERQAGNYEVPSLDGEKLFISGWDDRGNRIDPMTAMRYYIEEQQHITEAAAHARTHPPWSHRVNSYKPTPTELNYCREWLEAHPEEP